MSTQPSYSIVQYHLTRHQQSGDFAAQARTLMVMANLARKDYAYHLAHGLYGQAWEAYKQVNDIQGQFTAMFGILENLNMPWWQTWRERSDEQTLSRNRSNNNGFIEMIFVLCKDEPDLRHRATLYRKLHHPKRFRRVNELQRVYREALACYEQLGDHYEQANMLMELVRLARNEDLTMLERARQLYHVSGNHYDEGKIWLILGRKIMKQERPDYAAAQAHYEAARDLFLEPVMHFKRKGRHNEEIAGS